MEFDFLFLVLGWVAVAVIVYTIYTNAFLTVKTTPPSTGTTSGKVRFIFFSSSHCPWSQKARPQWESFVKDMTTHPTTFGGTAVSLEEIDGDSHEDMLKKHNVDSYPTFKLINGSKETAMNSMPSEHAFRDFLVKSLGAEEHTKLPTRTK